MSYAKNWCFTINNNQITNEEFLSKLSRLENINYVVFQEEQGAAGTRHLQGYIQLKVKKRLKWLRDNINDRAHYEVSKGSPDSNYKYCTKEDTRLNGPYEYGEITKGAGRRKDLETVRDMIKENPFISMIELAEAQPEVLAKYPRFIFLLKKEYARPTRTFFTPRFGWQQDLQEALRERPDPRKVKWYWEPTGNVGKSYFALNYVDGGGRNGYVVTGGRHSDIFFGYSFETVVFFDWTRDNAETVPYSVLESFKNGYFLNTKYESTPVRFEVPHVVVFANFSPNVSKLSMDRWEIKLI